MNQSRNSSAWVHGVFWALVVFGTFTAGSSWSASHGVLFAGAGLLMIACPPVAALPKIWWWLALGFLIAAAAVFLPVAWFGMPEWRAGLEGLGLDTGNMQAIQPRLASETLGVFALTLLGGLWLAGHRCSTEHLAKWALLFSLGVAVYALVSVWKQSLPPIPGETRVFGFFPNRNHTATYLAMGAITGLASLAQAIRDRRWWSLGFSVLAAGICFWAVLAQSESRSGVVLIVAGGGSWWLLLGRKYLGSNAWKAVTLLGLLVVGGFLVGNSKVKERIVDSTAKFQVSNTRSPAIRFADLDFRIPIWADTLDLIAAQPWTGVGAGNFAAVAPQYRERTLTNNDADGIHPESDWLWLAAETGIPAALCLAALVVIAAVYAIRQSRGHRARALRIGCVVGGLLLAFHGCFDVPGHRVPLAWAAALLFGLSLPASDSPPIAAPRSWPFQLGGTVMLAAGIWLLVGYRQFGNVSSVEMGTITRAAVEKLYREDLAKQKTAVPENENPAPRETDDLMEALKLTDSALVVLPLDRELWHWKGFLSLHYDDQTTEADRAFAIERALDPQWAAGPLRQARAWSPIDSSRTVGLWKESLRRAAVLDGRSPGSRVWRDRIVNQIREMAESRPELKNEFDRLSTGE